MNAGPWTFHNPVKVIFQPGATGQLPELVIASRIALITTPGFRKRGLVAQLGQSFGDRLVAVVDDVRPNPDLLAVEAQANSLRPKRPEVLLAYGGGSTIDTAKAVARILGQSNDADLKSILFGKPDDARLPALPVIAVPTTAGTGAEVTPFGTVWNYAERKKYSVVGDDLFPRLAVLDPAVTLQLPPEVTITSALDSVSHALESTWNRNATPVTLGLATRALQLSMQALPAVKNEPGNIEVRSALLQASTLAGLAISQSRTALAHAISYPITANFNLPHGLACSFTLPALLRFNAQADDGRLADLARSLGYHTPVALADALSDLFATLEIGTYLRKYGPDRASVMALTGQMFAPGRAENNLRAAAETDVQALVTSALDALQLQ
jgi:alcohol dehydrogenase